MYIILVIGIEHLRITVVMIKVVMIRVVMITCPPRLVTSAGVQEECPAGTALAR